jgi:hypothetical protein
MDRIGRAMIGDDCHRVFQDLLRLTERTPMAYKPSWRAALRRS